MSIDKIKRIIATGISFCLIGFFGLMMCIFIFPFITVVYRDKMQRQIKARGAISTAFSLFLKIMQAMGLFTLDVDDLYKIKDLKGTIVICNHPTLLDVVIIMSVLKGIQCIVKKELWSNFFLGGVVRNACYVRNDTDPEKFLKLCLETLENGENLLIFPEGTRTKPGLPLSLQRGVGNMALFTNKNIQALYMECNPITLTKGAKWYDVPPTAPNFKLEVGPMFDIIGDETNKPRSLRVRALMRDIQSYYNKRMGYE